MGAPTEMMLSVNGDRRHSFVAMVALVTMGIVALVVITVDNESALSSIDALTEKEAHDSIKAELKGAERDAKQLRSLTVTVEAPKKVKKAKKKMKKAKKKMKKAKKAKKKLKKAAGKGGKAGVKA